jgi:mRNA interferase RelE/StbE
MNYNLFFDEKAIEQLEKYPKEIRNRIFNKLQSTKNNPYHFFEKLEGRPEYKLRVGDYRIIADISDKKIKILVLYIGHRKNVYKKMKEPVTKKRAFV